MYSATALMYYLATACHTPTQMIPTVPSYGTPYPVCTQKRQTPYIKTTKKMLGSVV